MTLDVEPLIKTDIPQKTRLSWNTPVSLNGELEHSMAYPINALPPVIRNAVVAYQQYGQQPLPLIACSALANVSLACQTLANVARDSYLISPVSLYFLVIAASGERKSGADHAFSKATRQWQIDTRKKLESDIKIAQTLHQAWRVEKEGLLAQIRRHTLLNDATESLRDMLLMLAEAEPQIPLLPVLFFEDSTQEAMASHMADGWPSASLWTDEGGIVMSGHGMQANPTKFIALLNRLWDGSAFIAHRKTTQSFTVANRRLTVSLMMQPLVLEHMLAKNGGISRQSGFLARCLVAYPESAMGDRHYQEPPETLSALQVFQDRLINCLDCSLTFDKRGCHGLPVLNFSNQAKPHWISFFNEIETGLKNPLLWRSIKDFASKASENAARLAALFHLFSGSTGDISAETVQNACEVVLWHLFEARSILGNRPQTAEQENAQKLSQWLIEKELHELSPRYLLQYGPVRDKKCRDKAIELLLETHHIKEIKQDGKTVLSVNPHLFGGI